MSDLLPKTSPILPRIHIVRGVRVILDTDLAALYGNPTYRLNEAVKRNRLRFPEAYCFQLNREEVLVLRSSQFAMTLGKSRGLNYLPWAFTEHGALMSATVLSSDTAIAVSHRIIEAFVALRQLAADQLTLSKRLDELERTVGKHDAALAATIEALCQLAAPSAPQHGRRIGCPFHS